MATFEITIDDQKIQDPLLAGKAWRRCSNPF
jgi:hypothetical protein